MKHRVSLLTGLVLLVAAACAAGSSPMSAPPESSSPTPNLTEKSTPTPFPSAGPTSTQAPAPSPSPTPARTPGPTSRSTLNLSQLKLALIAAYGPLWYCDPDFYPVARAAELDQALARWSEVTAEKEAFAALLAVRGLPAGTAFTDAQKLDIYHEWKSLYAIALDPVGTGSYRFDYRAEPKGGAAEGTRTGGTIAADGRITVDQEAAANAPMCPICLARGTLIETPSGGVPVERLRIGDAAWTLDTAGRLVPATIIATGSTQAPEDHHVIHLVLADGRSVTGSPGHPLADGRRLGVLRPGDLVDGAEVVVAALEPYTGGETFDIVVSGPTGIYLVDGIALGSTLRP
jgi:hypothetical protein